MSTDVLKEWGIPAVITAGVAGMTIMLSVSVDVCPIEEMRYWQLEKPIRGIRSIPVYMVKEGFVGTKIPEPDSSSDAALASSLSKPEFFNGLIFANATFIPKADMRLIDAKKNDRGGYPTCNRKLFSLYESSAQQTRDFIEDANANKEINLTKLTNAIETNEKAWKELQRLDEKHYQRMLVGGYQD